MPNGDRTGPEGKGSGTGRKLGYCSGSDKSGRETGTGRGKGLGRGFGRGQGFGRGLGLRKEVSKTLDLSKDQQIKVLENEKREIEAKLKELSK